MGYGEENELKSGRKSQGKPRKYPRFRDDISVIVASQFNCSVRYVQQIRYGFKEPKTEKGKAILEALLHFQSGKNKLIREIERLIPIKNDDDKAN